MPNFRRIVIVSVTVLIVQSKCFVYMGINYRCEEKKRKKKEIINLKIFQRGKKFYSIIQKIISMWNVNEKFEQIFDLC